MIYGIIYKVTNKINNKSYIGETTATLKRRKSQHKYSAKNNKYKCVFHDAIRKYGWDNFKWTEIYQCNSSKELDEKEMYFIKEYNTFAPNGYNLTIGGNGKSGYKWTDETRQKQIEIKKGRPITEEHKKKISEGGKGNGRKYNDKIENKAIQMRKNG